MNGESLPLVIDERVEFEKQLLDSKILGKSRIILEECIEYPSG